MSDIPPLPGKDTNTADSMQHRNIAGSQDRRIAACSMAAWQHAGSQHAASQHRSIAASVQHIGTTRGVPKGCQGVHSEICYARPRVPRCQVRLHVLALRHKHCRTASERTREANAVQQQVQLRGRAAVSVRAGPHARDRSNG